MTGRRPPSSDLDLMISVAAAALIAAVIAVIAVVVVGTVTVVVVSTVATVAVCRRRHCYCRSSSSATISCAGWH